MIIILTGGIFIVLFLIGFEFVEDRVFSVRFVSLPKILNVPDHDFDDVVMFATAVNLKSKL